MTTPVGDGGSAIDPTVPSDTPIPTPTPTDTPTDQDVRDLATQLTAPQLSFDPADVRKGIIAAVAATASPPSVSLTLSGDDTVIPGVVALDSYSPVVGDTVLVIKQGTNIFVLGQLNDTGVGVENGWQTVGGVSYRVVIDNGDQRVQFKGSYAASGTSLFTLPSGYAPSVTRTILCGRDGESTSVLVQIATSGAVTVVNGTVTIGTDNSSPAGTAASTAPSGTTGGTAPGGSTATVTNGNTGSTGSDVSGTTGSLNPVVGSGTTSSHAHTIGHLHDAGGLSAGGHTHSNPSHWHQIFVDSHTHSVTTTGHTHTVSTTAHSHTQTLALPTTVYFDETGFFR